MSNHGDDIEDIEEFVNSAKDFKEDKLSALKTKKSMNWEIFDDDDEDSAKPKPGIATQYALHGGGYTATTATIPRLPAGIYEMCSDSKAIYVVPSMPPTGLLLELPEMRSEEIIKIVDTFWNSEKDYKEGNDFVIGGAQYKAGLMLYGSAGSGKSSTIKLVSKKLVEKGGTVFNASINPSHVNAFLTDFFRIEKDRKCIVILEDIDSLIDKMGENGYLEMLDSSKTIDNVMFIATTNYPDRLDPRIYNRPGRFSHVIKVGNPSAKAREAFLKAVLKNHRDVDYIVQNSQGFSIDHLSSLMNAVYREKKDLKLEIERLKALFRIPKIDETKIGF